MNLFKKIAKALHLKKDEKKVETVPIVEERTPTGNSRWTTPTDTKERKIRKRKNKLENSARNLQRTHS